MTPDRKQPDPMRASVANVAAAGERLRMELLDALRRTDRAESGGVQTELAMFYGQAFGNVHRALPDPLPSDLLSAKVLHECLCGQAVQRLWLLLGTPLDASDELTRMAGHWRKIAEMLLRTSDE